MRRLVHYCLFIPLLASTPRPAKETLVRSEIRSATVYLEGAQVNRKATTTVPAGRATLVFTGLTTALDPGSIQVATDQAAVQILAVSQRINFAERPVATPQEERLRTRIEALDRRNRQLRTEAGIAKEEEAILKANRQFAGQQNGLDAEDLVRGVAYHRERLTAIRMRYLVLEDSLQAIAERRTVAADELAQLGKSREQKTTTEVVVVTQSAQVTSAGFTLSYLVPNASWSPVYDVRVRDVASPVDLRYRARVRQQSGEDWADVKLTLSTGDPSLNAEAPELAVWRIRPNIRPPVAARRTKRETQATVRQMGGTVTDETGEPLIGATISVTGTNIGTVTDIDGRYRLTVPVGSSSIMASYTGYETKVSALPVAGERLDIKLAEGAVLDEVVVTGYGRNNRLRVPRLKRRSQVGAAPPPPPVAVEVERRATTVAFVIELPYTIPSDGQPRQVEIRQFDVPAHYRHLAIPKLSSDAYLTAKLTDWEQYDLISGEIQLFFEGTYLGQSYLDVLATSDTLAVSLGRDPGVVVTRKRNTDYRKRGFLSGKQTDSRGYTINVRNTKAQPIDLTIMDQVPLSGQSSIEIETDLPQGAKLNEEKGFLTWQLDLAPRQEWSAEFGYAVKYPKGMRVYLE